MAETIGQHGIAAFTNPSNGDALDANIVKGNDNSLRSVYVDHDSDPGIHVQSSLLASRPAAGTLGRKWLTTDSGAVRLWYDDGSAWQEISYVSSIGSPTFSSLTVTNDLTVDTSTLKVDSTNNRVGINTAVPVSTLDVSGTVRTSNTVTVTSGGITVSAGGITVTGNSSITGTLTGLTGVTVTGTVSATAVSGDGSALTNLNATNISSGTLSTSRLPATVSVTTIVAPTLQGAASTPRNTVNIGDSATTLLTLTAASTIPLAASGSGTNSTFAGLSGPAGTTFNTTDVRYLPVTIAGATWYIPALKY